ncbi:dephospho-CoA kinase [Mangrovibacter sp. MFB070]|uniref:dephospho-CoA kinase n=1 Tax=Mangrovibacter sp. MFB070 TaxID=1224318 RepID=UPI0004D6DA8D|nr:dephospho-CoA kinase [Mangrovibacter sp. MFB070]KEA53181.1 dephospho-CoA kinase [Mangrovibacter sp. MFB070]
MVFTVALTGGIGSGKSTVAALFANHGVSLVDADIIAREVVAPGQPALQKIAGHFGEQVINHEGALNRTALRELIFTDPKEKQWLNALLHPLIHQRTQQAIAQASSPYVLWVVPLLVENQLQQQADRVLVVDVSTETQLQRTMARDNVSRELAQHIISAQVSREARLAAADDIINNDGLPQTLTRDVARLHQRYMALAMQSVRQE